jgi:hypothetical protein
MKSKIHENQKKIKIMSKTKFLSLATIALLAITSISCSTSDPDTTPVITPPPVIVGNTGDLKLFVIDTAKVKTITMTGTNETTILNKKINLNSYIGDFSLNSDATKFVYIDNQGTTKTIRTANANGTNDALIYTAPANSATVSTQIKYVKFGATKIYFATDIQTITGPTSSIVTKMNTINFDGTGLVSENAPFGGSDTTNDSKYIASKASIVGSTNEQILIFDRNGDNGAGSLYHSVNVPTTKTFFASAPVFSYDNKFAYYSYIESQNLKVVIINMTTKTSETKTIATGISFANFWLNISVASDNNRGVVVVKDYGTTTIPSKSYVFNLTSSTSTSFNNNDAYIYDVHAF